MKKILTLLLLFLFIINVNAQSDKVNQPIKNFEALWSEFNLKYANFELKNIDWKAMYKKYRPSINENTTDQKLFEVCCAMVQELNDGHVTIDPNFKKEIECGPPYTFHLEEEFPTLENRIQFVKNMDLTLQNFGFSKPIQCKVTEETNFHFRVSREFGYLRIDEMTEKTILRKLKRALHKAMKEFQYKDGLIIDLRFNGGGNDDASYIIAQRLVKEKKVGHRQKERIKGTNNFTPLKTFYVKPKGKYQFTKPIIVLTSDDTASASEVFLLAIKDLPYVTIVGDTTEGIFSETYEFKLPNKWMVSLSGQQLFSEQMINYEEKGITPDYKILNTKEKLLTKTDSVIAKAIEVLKEKTNHR